MSNKELDQVLEGPIVAVQYPDKPNFSVSASTASELSVKYSHLKDLDVDDKKAYKELTAAISDVSSNRILITKEEDAIKKPLNAFRKIVIDTGKALRSAFEPIENSLREEKDRIDTVLADREAAERKMWEANLQRLKLDLQRIPSTYSIENIVGAIEYISSMSIPEDGFGDKFEEAKTLKVNAIESLKERLKFEEEKAAFEKQQKEAEEQKARDDAEKAEMAAKIAKFEAESKPLISDHKDEHEIKLDNGSTIKYKDVPDSSGMVGFDKASSPHDESVASFVEAKDDAEIETIHDGTTLCIFIQALSRANNMRVISKSQEQNEAVNRVKETLVKAIGYLEKFDV